jgi:hypothetical protein
MAQRIFWNFKDDDATADIIRWMLGIIVPGRYRGFDFVPQSGLTVRLNQATTGLNQVRSDLSQVMTGMAVTPQGCVVQQDGNIDLPVTAPVSDPRIDIIVLSHQYEEIEGGNVATFSVVEGVEAASPVAPAVADATTDIILGQIYLPAGITGTDDAGVVYTQSLTPGLAGQSAQLSSNLGTVAISEVTGKKNLEMSSVDGTALTDYDDIKATGFYRIPNIDALSNAPSVSGVGFLIVLAQGDYYQQIVVASNFVYYMRNGQEGFAWSAWDRLARNSDLTVIDASLAALEDTVDPLVDDDVSSNNLVASINASSVPEISSATLNSSVIRGTKRGRRIDLDWSVTITFTLSSAATGQNWIIVTPDANYISEISAWFPAQDTTTRIFQMEMLQDDPGGSIFHGFTRMLLFIDPSFAPAGNLRLPKGLASGTYTMTFSGRIDFSL